MCSRLKLFVSPRLRVEVGSAGLDDDGSSARDAVARGGVARVAEVQVSGQEDVGPRVGERLERADDRGFLRPRGGIVRVFERMVCDDDLDCVRRRRGAALQRRGADPAAVSCRPLTVNERVVLRPTATNSGSVWTGRRFVVM